jgi:hypothetical protein
MCGTHARAHSRRRFAGGPAGRSVRPAINLTERALHLTINPGSIGQADGLIE